MARSTSSLPRDVVILSTADWDNPIWTNKQHVAVTLSKRGFRVLYVESVGLRKPTSKTRDLRRMAGRLFKGVPGVRRVEDKIWVYSPLVIPVHERRTVRRFNDLIVSADLAFILSVLRFSEIMVWSYNPLSLELAKRLRGDVLVYHCVDNLAAAPGMPAGSIGVAEASLMSHADMVFATSPPLYSHCVKHAPDKTRYLPNVADFKLFAQARNPGPDPPDLVSIPHPRIGFVGAVSPYKLDFQLVSRVSELRPDWHWTLIGPIGEGQPNTVVEPLRKPNIHFLGTKRHTELPAYLRGLDVATIPATRNEYTRMMFPMKFFEYLAAGKPVVTTELESLRGFKRAYYSATCPEDFIAKIERILKGDVPDLELGTRLASEHTWERRMDKMLDELTRRTIPE